MSNLLKLFMYLGRVW